MLRVGATVFILTSREAGAHQRGERLLYPALVQTVRDDLWRVVCVERVDIKVGQEISLFLDDQHVFMQRRARIADIHRGEHAVAIGLLPEAEDATPADGSRAPRISARASALSIRLGENETPFRVVDISATGLGLEGPEAFPEGCEVTARLLFEDEALDGTVIVTRALERTPGIWRLGVRCQSGVLGFALGSVHRQVERRFVDDLLTRDDDDRTWSFPSAPEIRGPASAPATTGPIAGEIEPHSRRVILRFQSMLAFEQEFQRNIAHGGIFVPTAESFCVRERVEIELDLRFCNHRVVLEAEVISCSPPDATREGDPVGIAVQFVDSAQRLRDVLAELSGVAPPKLVFARWMHRGPARRPHRRTHTRVAAVVELRGESRPAYTRNVSRSGALLAFDGDPPPLRSEVFVTLVDPSAGTSARMRARVVRQIEHEGAVSAVGVRFALDPDGDSPETRFIEGLQSATHEMRLGHLSGTLLPVGLANLLQLLAVCVDEGRVVVHSGDESAVISFARGAFCHARVGRASGLKALARVLDWHDGDFEFKPTRDREDDGSISIPIESALLECSHQVDELARLAHYPFDPLAVLKPGKHIATTEVAPAERDLILWVGSTVQQVVDQFPVYDSEVLAVLDRLLCAEVLELQEP